MSLENQRDRETCVWVEEDFCLREVLHKRSGFRVRSKIGKMLRGGDVDDGLAVASFRANVGNDSVLRGQKTSDGKGGTPARIV
jgi:hypothetical protein